jgi:hypothetical protein
LRQGAWAENTRLHYDVQKKIGPKKHGKAMDAPFLAIP